MEETDSCTITYDTVSNYVAVQYSAFTELIKRNGMRKYNYYEKYGEKYKVKKEKRWWERG